MPIDYKDPKLKSFLIESLQLSWKLATCVPPMIVSCDEKHYDRRKHTRSSFKGEVPKEHTHVLAHGQVEIKFDSATDQPSEIHNGTHNY